MSLALLLTSAGVIFSGSDVKGAAAEVVSSMDYYSTNDGPTITHSGVWYSQLWICNAKV